MSDVPDTCLQNLTYAWSHSHVVSDHSWPYEFMVFNFCANKMTSYV